MTKEELLSAINSKSAVFFDGIKCLPVGYQVLLIKNQKHYSAGLREIKTGTLHWVELSRVEKSI